MVSSTKPCNCPVCTGRRREIDQRLRNSLTNIDNQFKESRKKNKEYDKTVRLLRLVKR